MNSSVEFPQVVPGEASCACPAIYPSQLLYTKPIFDENGTFYTGRYFVNPGCPTVSAYPPGSRGIVRDSLGDNAYGNFSSNEPCSEYTCWKNPLPLMRERVLSAPTVVPSSYLKSADMSWQSILIILIVIIVVVILAATSVYYIYANYDKKTPE